MKAFSTTTRFSGIDLCERAFLRDVSMDQAGLRREEAWAGLEPACARFHTEQPDRSVTGTSPSPRSSFRHSS